MIVPIGRQEQLGSEDTLDTRQLMLKKAEWARSMNDPKAAAEFYLLAGESLKAVEIAGRHGWVNVLVDYLFSLASGVCSASQQFYSDSRFI